MEPSPRAIHRAGQSFMQEMDPTFEPGEFVDTDVAPTISRRALRRLLYIVAAALAVLLLVLLPPLISLNRYQRRIANSIGQSLGRPVHLDKVSLNLLPLPGFALENFVVDEDPAFGNEPVIRANSVNATLRISSLWSRRFEFSTISFTDPSVNLVHLSNGKWNLDSILLHAAHIDAAPTAQKKPGPAPRFPYIEATGARLNLKLGNEKTPISFTDADFALWLPDPQQWHLRLRAHPARTDTNASDTGLFSLEGTLGRAASLSQVPLSLQGVWRNVPLGQASLLLLGRDAGLRGDLTLSANAQGTIGNSAIQTRIQIIGGRRAEFVPAIPLDADVQCLATATADFHTFEDIHCAWPPSGTSAPPTFTLTSAFLDVRNPAGTPFEIATPGLPASVLLDWLRIASPRVPADISATGTLTGAISYHPNSPNTWQGQLQLADASLINPHPSPSSLLTGDTTLQSIVAPAPDPRHGLRRASAPIPNGFELSPTMLDLGGKEPATLDGHIGMIGYTLHLTGMASLSRLHALAAAIPQLGDGLNQVLPANRAAGPFRIDLTCTHPWGYPQTWIDNTTQPSKSKPRHRG
jgi:AsmA family